MALDVIVLVILANLGNLVVSSVAKQDVFAEELYIKPLPSGHLYSFFQFTTKWKVDTDQTPFRHYNLFPRPIGEIIEKHSVRELHVSLTQGLWRTEKWGYPTRSAGSGAEISAWFQPNVLEDDIDSKWLGLVNSLSGLFCASFNFVNLANTISPEWSFGPKGLNVPGSNFSHLRYAQLPREIVCTENLTPWKKLLPCESHSGLGELLEAKKMYNSNYHSLGLDLRPTCWNSLCQESALELKLSLSLVTEPTVFHGEVSDGIKNDWSFKSTYGSQLFTSCPRAELSKVYVDVTTNVTNIAQWDLLPNTYSVVMNQRGGILTNLAAYDLKSELVQKPLNVRAIYKKKQTYGLVPAPIIHATRVVGGYGQAKGMLTTRIHNNYHSSDIEIVHLELIPWYCRVFIHTLSVTNSRGKKVDLGKLHFRPGLDRQRPHHLEIRLTLPANSVTKIEWEFHKGFLKWTEYPPDAHRGFDLGPAVISALLPVARNWTGLPRQASFIDESWNVSEESFFTQVHTDSLVLAMATPDFSMPYNVICLVCTVVALAFGPLYNLTTKRLVLKESGGDGTGIRAKIRSLIQRIRKKPTEEEEAKKEKCE